MASAINVAELKICRAVRDNSHDPTKRIERASPHAELLQGERQMNIYVAVSALLPWAEFEVSLVLG